MRPSPYTFVQSEYQAGGMPSYTYPFENGAGSIVTTQTRLRQFDSSGFDTSFAHLERGCGEIFCAPLPTPLSMLYPSAAPPHVSHGLGIDDS